MRHGVSRLLLIALVSLCGYVACQAIAPAHAQQPAQQQADQPDYAAWQRVASRAFDAIESSRASTPAFEELRTTLVGWRDLFQDAQGINANAIATVRRQLDALGPPPDAEQGEPETEDVAELRSALTEEINRLDAPVRAAQQAFTSADELIRGIDRIIRDRQAEQILAHGASPLNPAQWPTVFDEFQRTARDITGEFTLSLANPVQRAQARDNLPVAVIEALLGLLLLFRGRVWTRALTTRLFEGDPSAGRWIAAFLVSSGSLILPFVGILLIVAAAQATGLGGITIDQMLGLVAIPVFFFLLARWVGTRVFPVERARTLPLNLSAGQRARGRLYSAILGLLAAINYFLRETGRVNNWSGESLAVMMFPFTLVCAILLWRLAALLRQHVRADAEDDGIETYRSRTTRVLSFGLVIVSVLAPVLAATGYFELSQFLLYPTLASLQLIGLLLILQRLVVEVYVLVTGNRDGAAESLIPILIGFAMTLAALPLFSIFWGARPADISELWAQLAEGYEVGGILISPTNFLTFALIFTLGYMATRLVQGMLKNTILPKTRLDVGGRNAIVSGMGYVGVFLAALIAITAAGIDLSSLAIVAGALSVGIGFGLQTIVSNFVSGIILLVERPISEGDWIEVSGVHGTVKQIAVRATVIQTFDRSDVIVPNSDLVSGQVTNYTRTNTLGRLIVPVGVAYGSDTQEVETILREVAEAHPLVILSPPPMVLFRAFGASSLDFEVRVILRDVNYVLSVQSELNHEINRRFREAGIEIPFAQTDIWVRNPGTQPGSRAPKELATPWPDDARRAEERAHRTDTPGHSESETGAEPHSDADGAGDGDAR